MVKASLIFSGSLFIFEEGDYYHLLLRTRGNGSGEKEGCAAKGRRHVRVLLFTSIYVGKNVKCHLARKASFERIKTDRKKMRLAFLPITQEVL